MIYRLWLFNPVRSFILRWSCLLSHHSHQLKIPGCDPVQVGFIENGTLRQDVYYNWRKRDEEFARLVQSYFHLLFALWQKLSNHFSNLIDGKGSNTTLQILSVRGVPSKDNIGAFGPKSKFLSEGRSYRKGGNTNPLFLEYFLQQKKLCLEGSPSPLTEKICKRVFNILLLSTLRF